MIIAIGNDHGGYQLKMALMKALENEFDFIDCGTYDEESCDYPDYAYKVGNLIRTSECDFGLLICKSGIGMSIAANKIKGVYCALVSNDTNAGLAHKHNNANCLALGANDVDLNMAIKIVKAYANETFEERHTRRIDKIKAYEGK